MYTASEIPGRVDRPLRNPSRPTDVVTAMRLWSRSLVALTAVLATTVVAPPPLADAGPVNSFVDDDNSRFEPFIETAHANGLVTGCNPPDNDRVCPHHHVSRGSMAIMLARALGVSPSRADHFTDDDGHVSEGAIDGLIDAGVGLSCEKKKVCPDRPITRGEMAALISRAFTWDRVADPDEYADLADSPFRDALAKLAARGGLLTCDPPVNERLCPQDPVRRDEAVYALVSVMGLAPAVTAPRHTDTAPLGFGDGFDELSLWDGRSPSSRNRVELTDHGYRETALRVRIPKGSHYGADFHLHLSEAAAEPPEQLYFRYYVKFDDDWRTTSSGKLPGFSGVYGSSGKGGHPSSSTQPGWSARLMFGPNHTEDDRIDLGYYVYHLGQEKRYGDGLGWNEAGKLKAGEWYCLEGEVELNTLGVSDGALRAWVDGTPAFDLSGLEFRRPSEPEIKIESFWFNVYYGGKAVAPQQLGLTIDEVVVDTDRVGCGAGKGTTRSTEGDFDGDGYPDRVWWGDCPGGTCFWMERSSWVGKRISLRNGDGAWFNLDSHRLGLVTGDVNGDGRTDVVYHGRCNGSEACWRVHDARSGMSTGHEWGGGEWFSSSTDRLILGDWNGDGLDDLAYRGLCGSDARSCWRVHLSNGSAFDEPRGWGRPPDGSKAAFAADVTGDGRDDLIYQAPCDEAKCWYAQQAQESSFADPVALGLAIEASTESTQWMDFDGDAVSDIVTWVNGEKRSRIEVRFIKDGRLGSPVALASLDAPIDDVALRRLGEVATVQAVVQTTCEDTGTCIERLMSPAPGLLVDSTLFRDARWDRPGAPKLD